MSKHGNNSSRQAQSGMPEELPTGNIPTLNGYGTAFPTFELWEDFLHDAAQNRTWSLDIGCAYGIQTIEAIKRGARVVANDLDPNHLRIVRKKLPAELSLNLRTRAGAFERIVLPAESIGCALAGYMIHFLDGAALVRMLKKLRTVLHRGGTFYANAWSPYIKPLEDLIPEFERRKAAGETWPGHYEQIAGRMGSLMPNEIHVFDPDVLSGAFTREGFVVDECRYVEQLRASRRFDGREMVYIRARKA